jgi:flagellar hook-associated protein 3 FlgL
MIKTTDADAQRFLSALEASQARSSRALQQVSTGYKVMKPSDSPGDVMDIIRLNARISQGDQVSKNLTLAKSEADIADSTLQTVINLLENALSIGMQGTDEPLTAETRAGLASQVQQIHQQIVTLSQLNVQGRYIFSGDQDQNPQYIIPSTPSTDPAVKAIEDATGVHRQFQATMSRQVTDMVGGSFQASESAEYIFDHRNSSDDSVAADNVFAALTSLKNALNDNNQTDIANAVHSIKLALDHVNSALTFYGGVENRIQSSAALVDKYQLQWQQSLSGKRDADPIQAITDLQQAQTQQDAALGARAKFGQHSLFDFLT